MPNQKNRAYQRIGAIFGLTVPPLAFTCILTAIALYPAFSWTNNALSDLGVVSGVTGPIFNFGLVASGVLAFIFSILGLFNYFRDRLIGKIGALTFAAATIALTAIGIFNESFSPTHYVVSVLFFVLLPIAFWVLTAAFYVKHEVKLAVLTLVASFVAGAPWVLYFIVQYVPKVAIPETISALTGSVWIITVSIKILKTANYDNKRYVGNAEN